MNTMDKESAIAEIFNYAKKGTIVWRSVKATRKETLILEALELNEQAPFRIIKLYKNNAAIICAFITLAGEVSIISSDELNDSKILNELFKIAKKQSFQNIEIKSLKNIDSIDEIFEQELFTYYYLQKEQEKRQRYRKTLLLTAIGFAVFSILFAISFIFFLEKGVDMNTVEIINLLFILFALLVIQIRQYRIYKEIKASVLSVQDKTKSILNRIESTQKSPAPRATEHWGEKH